MEFSLPPGRTGAWVAHNAWSTRSGGKRRGCCFAFQPLRNEKGLQGDGMVCLQPRSTFSNPLPAW